MRILLIGGGVTGGRLAAQLSAERHDVVLVDTDPRVLAEVVARHDVLTVEGSGALPHILEQAGVTRSDMFVAVTNDDAVNLFACAVAKRAGVARTVARVSDSGFLRETPWCRLTDLGVDTVVSQRETGADELFNILMLPAASEVVPLLDGRLHVVGFPVTEGSPLYGARLGAFPEPEHLRSLRFLVVLRGGSVIIPRGDTVFIGDDQLYVVGPPAKVHLLLDWACPARRRLKRVIIAGGGGMGLPLAKRLEDTRVQVVLMESDEVRANFCSSQLNETLVLRGDAVNEEILAEAGITDESVFVALTGNDERNILSCLLAKQSGVPFVIAQVHKPELSGVLAHLKTIDRVVSAKETIINAILHMTRSRDADSTAFLRRAKGELVTWEIDGASRWAGKAVSGIPLPRNAVIAGIDRKGTAQIATGETTIAAGDRLVVFALPDAVRAVNELFDH